MDELDKKIFGEGSGNLLIVVVFILIVFVLIGFVKL